MERKPFRKQLLFPPVWLMLLLAAISAAGLILVFTEDLTVSIAVIVMSVFMIIRTAKEMKERETNGR